MKIKLQKIFIQKKCLKSAKNLKKINFYQNFELSNLLTLFTAKITNSFLF